MAARPSGSGHWDRARGEGDAAVLGEGVPGVAGEGHRDAVRGLLGQLLHGVLPAGGLPRGGQVVQVQVVDQPIGHQLAGRVRADPGRGVVLPGLAHADDRVEEQPGLLLNREPGEEVGDPLLGRQPGVLVGGHHPVAVQVAEPDPLGGDSCPSRAHRASRWTVTGSQPGAVAVTVIGPAPVGRTTASARPSKVVCTSSR